jgi:hypothetical protein
MNNNPLDELLNAYAKQPLPPTSGGDLTEIWRSIETRRRQPFWSRVLPLLEWRELFLDPRIAGAAFAVAIAIGIVPGYIAANRANAETQLARHSLHFEVFSAGATDLLANRQATAKL